MDDEKGAKFLHWLKRCSRLETYTNEELSDLLLSDVWADLVPMTFESDLIAEVIDRLKGKQRRLVGGKSG
jgi:hypothetical protein